MISEFKTVFLITKEAYTTEPYFLGLLAFIGGSLLLIFQLRKKIVGWKKYFKSIFIMFWGLVWFGLSLNMQISYNKVLNRHISFYNNRQYEIVEGPVNVKYLGKKEGHDGGDMIEVDRKEFRLNHFMETPLYHESIIYGGVLRQGVNVKIYHHNGNILRIDVQDSL